MPLNIDWCNRKQVINLAQDMANKSTAQIVYKVQQRTNYNICHAENWPRFLAELERQDYVIEFVLTVERATYHA